MLNPHAILIDFDDTLAYSSRSRRPLLEAELRLWGGSASDVESIRSRWGQPFRELVSSTIRPELYERFLDSYKQRMRRNPPIACPGAFEFLHELHSRGVPVIVVTSSLSDLVREDLVALEMQQFVGAIFGADETSFHKPDPRVFVEIGLEMARRGYGELEDFLFIGDSLSDYTSSIGVCSFWAVLTGETSEEAFVAAGLAQREVFASLKEILPLLSSP